MRLLQKQLIDKTQNAQREIQELIVNPLNPDAFELASEQYQRELDDIVAAIKATQAELDKLLGKQQEVAKAATTQGRAAIAADLQPTLSSAGDVALFETARQIQAALDLVKAANASLGEANRQGNTAAADVANGYLNNLIPAIRVLIGQYIDRMLHQPSLQPLGRTRAHRNV